MATKNSGHKKPLTKIQRLSFKVSILRMTGGLILAHGLLLLNIGLGGAGFVHPDRRAKHLITED
jgi:hypothetical protein